jgi:hypothetical protein
MKLALALGLVLAQSQRPLAPLEDNDSRIYLGAWYTGLMQVRSFERRYSF